MMVTPPSSLCTQLRRRGPKPKKYAGSRQLLGQEERKYLEIYLLAYTGVGFVREQEVQRTAMRLLTHGKKGLSRAMMPDEGGRWHAVNAAANESLLLSCIAGGKVLCRSSHVNEAQPYIDCACALVSHCAEAPVLDLMLAYLNLAFMHAAVEDYTGIDEDVRILFEDVMGNMPGHHLAPGSMFMCYSPPVEGFPDPMSNVREEDRAAIGGIMVAMQPEVKHEEELVATASRGHTRLLPLVFGIDLKVVQVMTMINATPRGVDFAAAREAGARLQRITERLVASIANESFFAKPGMVHLAVAWDIIFLRLLACDEEGCLQALRRTAHMLAFAPGLLRFPTHWVATLLLNAGLRAEHDALTHAVNAMGLAQGRDLLPLHEEGKARLCLCSEFRCAAVHRIVADMNLRGAARIFTHCTQLDLHPSEVAAIDLATQPSALYITWCGRAPNTKLWERVTPEEGIALEALPRNATNLSDMFAATASTTRVSSAASSRDADHGNSGGDATNRNGERVSCPLVPAGTVAASNFDDTLDPRAGALRLPMPRPVRPPLPADVAQDAFYGTDDYRSDDGIPKGATGAGASGLGVDVSHWRGVADTGVGADFAAGSGSSGRAASFDPDADHLYDAAGLQDAPVDEELLAQLAAELDDESLLDMADACFKDSALNPVIQQHQQQQQQQHPQSVLTQAAIDTGGLFNADLSAALQHPYPLQPADHRPSFSSP
ncbi:hypothetical protein JKP88DRAFT_300559 [Tribonema minus]|uniref:Uncharacterized protein n=1 Tax=Tribonema minus TaxID=303371 RepID=A0A835ZB53_9STRA|nr:hypothetical protein JKP88DRAFT_300559 [Tribonema minus]